MEMRNGSYSYLRLPAALHIAIDRTGSRKSLKAVESRDYRDVMAPSLAPFSTFFPSTLRRTLYILLECLRDYYVESNKQQKEQLKEGVAAPLTPPGPGSTSDEFFPIFSPS